MRSAKLRKTNKTCIHSHADPGFTIIYAHVCVYMYVFVCVCVYLCVFVSHETKGENEMGEQSQERWG